MKTNITSKRRIIAMILSVVLCLGCLLSFAGCGEETNTRPDALVIMTEELDGLFNPFYSTTANDATIVGMTQVAMLSTKLDGNGDVVEAFGDGEAVVTKDYAMSYDESTDKTTYTFVLKNNLKFSDGKPLTMNDVLFNFYVYLDPVYTGSSTMYSTDIVGLQAYRTQSMVGDDSTADSAMSESANASATNRTNELINIFNTLKNGNKDTDYAAMVDAINKHSLSYGYKSAVSADPASVTNAKLLEDYEYALRLFKEELALDYNGASSNFVDTEPYKSYKGLDFNDPIVAFMLLEGFIEFEYVKDENGRDDKSQIKGHHLNYNENVIKTQQDAVDFVYNSMISESLPAVLLYSASASTIRSEYVAHAMQILLEQNREEDGSLVVKNIKGIVSLGHTTETTSVTLNGNTYTVAHEHNADGTVKNSGEYDVLQITINGRDPKAVWNFAIAIAPQHYYAKGLSVDIANDNFGVEFGSFDFMKNKIQANNRVPVGAGAYMATNESNGDNPSGTEFYSNNVVYFKANPHFMMGQAKIEKIRYQVVSSTNALAALESGSVHYVTPQFTQNNIDKVNAMKDQGIMKLSSKQLGYGYIGINAGKVQDINLRRAIMCAMDISQALSYYSPGTAENIYWPMSTVSWAYPKNADGSLNRDNGLDYPAISFSETAAKELINEYMQKAGVSAGDKKLELTFTIAGANMTEHPAYAVFDTAAKILNECGWKITVVPDVQALTKLSTGSLTVWAAAWGSSVDPDMYQVYHKNSTATSTLAWGYNVVVGDETNFPEENKIIKDLSDLIDEARDTFDREVRSEKYQDAMRMVMDLAIELPVYQRDVLYVYDSNVIKADSLPSEVNPYTSPLDRIWEIEFAN